MPQKDKQKTLSALIIRLADFDGKGINRLRVGDMAVVTYLIQILDMWRKKLNKIAASDRAEKEYWRKTIKDIEKEDGTHINSKALLDTLPSTAKRTTSRKANSMMRTVNLAQMRIMWTVNQVSPVRTSKNKSSSRNSKAFRVCTEPVMDVSPRLVHLQT
jgi:hypothetical protein